MAKNDGGPAFADVIQAVARGWTTPENSRKEVDVELAVAITHEIMAMLQAREVDNG